jgi:hypothetical protein
VGDPPSLSSALASLPSQLDRLKVLSVASRAFQSYADDGPGTVIVQKDLAGIDSAVAAVHSPALIRFQLSVLLPEGLPAVDQYASVTDSQLAVTKTRTALVRAFPLMHSRGVLAVRDYRGAHNLLSVFNLAWIVTSSWRDFLSIVRLLLFSDPSSWFMIC